MVLIISDHEDFSTNQVINWLDHMKCSWLRINETDIVEFVNMEIENQKIIQFCITINGKLIDLTKIKAYWYRRGWLNNNSQRDYGRISRNQKINNEIKKYINQEIGNLFEFIHHYLEANCRININNFLFSRNNKTLYQYLAMQAGLTVPNTLITTSDDDLSCFSKKGKGKIVITKSINELFSFCDSEFNYFTKIHIANAYDRQQNVNTFAPTLFQYYVHKYVEIRVFYIHGDLYPMAIFSQQNEKTRLDYRNYDDDRPNRCVPAKLPRQIENRIKRFMKLARLNCGSLDLILTPEGEYIFLEVNPVGQYGMVSEPCNYFLNRKIAAALFQSTNKKMKNETKNI